VLAAVFVLKAALDAAELYIPAMVYRRRIFSLSSSGTVQLCKSGISGRIRYDDNADGSLEFLAGTILREAADGDCGSDLQITPRPPAIHAAGRIGPCFLDVSAGWKLVQARAGG